MNTPEPEKKETGTNWRRELLSWVRCFVGALLVVALLRICLLYTSRCV